MLKIGLILPLWLSASACFGAVKISAVITAANQVMTPTLVCEEGIWTKVNEGNLSFNVMATSEGNLVTITSEIAGKTRGKFEVINKSTVITAWDEPATITASNAGSEDSLSLKIKVSRVIDSSQP